MMQALAAETAAAQGGHAVAFYATAEFWVLVAFVIFVVAAAKPLFRMVTQALDDKAETIRNQLDEAARLREEAQELLASYQRKQRDALKETEDIAQRAREDADRLAAKAVTDLERALKRREQLAIERIAQAETKAMDEVRAMAVDAALEATRRILAENVKGEKADALVAAAIKELPDKLH